MNETSPMTNPDTVTSSTETAQAITAPDMAITNNTSDAMMALPTADTTTPAEHTNILSIVFGHDDIILKATFICLLLMSILSWSVIIYRTLYALYSRRRYQQHLKLFISVKDGNYQNAFDQMKGASPIKRLLGASLLTQQDRQDFADNPQSQLDYADYLMTNIKHHLSESINTRDGGLTVLASVGSTAPFVGLFGTVWGIYHALLNISTMGSVNIATISGPIGEALIATAFGLFVAIPAVLAYNALNRMNRVFGRNLDSFAHDLYRLFLRRP